MSIQLITIASYWLLLYCSCDGYEVFQPASQMLNPNGTFSITCEHTDTGVNSTMDARLNRIPKLGYSAVDKDVVCQIKRVFENCSYLKKKSNQYEFTVRNVGPGDLTWLYECEFSNISAIPIKTIKGHPTMLFQAFQCLTNTESVSMCPTAAPPLCPKFDLPHWLLIGLSTLFLLYSLAITFVYVKLKVTRSEELYDSLTYTSTQLNQAMRRGGDPECNSTYMDMRKVPFGMRVSQAHHSG